MPASLMREFQQVCNRESRTRSEVIRSALRSYFDQHSEALLLTVTEAQAVREERDDFHHGSSASAGKLVHDLSSGGNLSGANLLLAAAANRATSARLKQGETQHMDSQQWLSPEGE